MPVRAPLPPQAGQVRKSSGLGLGSTVLPRVEESTFLVSHPLNNPDARSVMFVVRCDGTSVIAYNLPEVSRNTRMPVDASVLCSVPTMMMANFAAAAGAFDTLPLDPIAEDIKSGKLLVVTHADPWGVMVSATQSSAWRALLQSLGGKYAALADQSRPAKVPMQRHPLMDLV